ERLAAEEAEYARLEAEYAEAERLAREQAARSTAIEEAPDPEDVGSADIAADIADADVHVDVDARADASGEPVDAGSGGTGDASPPQQPDAGPGPGGLAAIARVEDPQHPLDLSGLDPELVDIFVEEGMDLLDHSDALLASLRESPDDREILVGLQRDLHTLKGGARMAGIMEIGELGHAMESLLEVVVDQRQELGRDGVPLLEAAFDRLHRMVTRVGERQAIALPQALIEEFDARARGEARVPDVPSVVDPEESAAVPASFDPGPMADAGEVSHARPVSTPAEPVQAAAAPIDAPATVIPAGDTPQLPPLSPPVEPMAAVADEDDIAVRLPQEQVRIRADLLDRLVNYAGEVAIYRARLEQQLGAFRGAIAEMAATNTRIRDQLRRLEMETEAQIVARYQREGEEGEQSFDPLELDRFSDLQQLSRALAESAADQDSLQQTLDDLTRQYETLLLQQSR